MTSAEVAHSKCGKLLPVESLNFQPLACSVAKCFSQDCHKLSCFHKLSDLSKNRSHFWGFHCFYIHVSCLLWRVSCIQSAHMSHHSDRRHCHIAWPSSSLLSSRLNRRKVASFHTKNNRNVSKSTPTRRFPRHLI